MTQKRKNLKEFNIPIKIVGKERAYNEEQDQKEKQSEEATLTEHTRENFKNIQEADANDRKKVMWIIVGAFMAVIIIVWSVFLKYNMFLEKISLKQMEEKDKWERMKNNFETTFESIEKTLSDFNMSQEEIQKDAEDGLRAAITDKNIEKLKERIIEKNTSSTTTPDY